jgi:hypothetical protein
VVGLFRQEVTPLVPLEAHMSNFYAFCGETLSAPVEQKVAQRQRFRGLTKFCKQILNALEV